MPTAAVATAQVVLPAAPPRRLRRAAARRPHVVPCRPARRGGGAAAAAAAWPPLPADREELLAHIRAWEGGAVERAPLPLQAWFAFGAGTLSGVALWAASFLIG